MVFPFFIGAGLAILASVGVSKAFEKIDDVRGDIRDMARTATDITTDVRHDVFGIIRQVALTIDHIACNLTNNVNAITHGCLNSIEMVSHRIDISVHLLTNTIMAFVTTCSLGLLLYLTDFSPFLRTIVWFLFISVCFYMVRNYVIHSNLIQSPQKYTPSIHSAIAKKNTIRGTTAITVTVKPLIKQQLTPNILLNKPCAVIMGKAGAGKTTLFNGLCGTERPASEGNKSITRNLFCSDVNCGDNTFSLIDTPGTDSSTEVSEYAILLRDGLAATEINTIFIVIKYNSRFDKMIDHYFEVEQPVKNNTNKIVVMVSYGDQSNNPQNSFNKICQLFEEECPNVTNLIFYSEGSSKPEISNLMYNCISNMTEERLNINI